MCRELDYAELISWIIDSVQSFTVSVVVNDHFQRLVLCKDAIRNGNLIYSMVNLKVVDGKPTLEVILLGLRTSKTKIEIIHTEKLHTKFRHLVYQSQISQFCFLVSFDMLDIKLRN